MDSLDTDFLVWLDLLDLPGLIDKGSYNAVRSRGCLPTFLGENYLDKDILVTLLELTSKIQFFQMHQCHNIALLSLNIAEHNMEIVRLMEKMGRVRVVEIIEKVRGMNKANRKII